MISRVMLFSKNLAKAEVFYDLLLALFGAKKTAKSQNAILWKAGKNGVDFAVYRHDKEQVNPSDNAVVCLQASTAYEVTLIYKAALRLGAICAGKPTNVEQGVQAAYFLEADNNKIGIFHSKAK
mgnify:CR=1 FL=1